MRPIDKSGRAPALAELFHTERVLRSDPRFDGPERVKQSQCEGHLVLPIRSVLSQGIAQALRRWGKTQSSQLTTR